MDLRHTFRDVSDIEKSARLSGGLLGLEAAHGLATRGAKITLLHMMDQAQTAPRRG
jgi:NAD(P)H-nitrite reductase large subunit